MDRPRRAARWVALVAVALSGVSAAWAQKGGAEFSVSDFGQPTYSYPIGVPPGIAGMEPKLSLSYSGSTYNGPVGAGWSIQGFSVITRCGAIPAIDGKRSAVGYVAADKLCLDGNRLIQVDGTGTPLALANQVNDAAGLAAGAYTEYRTEKDQYARIRAYGSAGGSAANGPAYFVVWTKSGQIYEYGNTTDSQIVAQGKSAVMVWALDKISDTLGNYVAFKYTVSQSTAWGSGTSAANPRPGTEWNLAEVWYTGTASQAPTNKVVFTYGARTDNAEAYHAGSKNVSTQLLQTIKTYVNAPATLGSTGLGVKSLQLTYGSGWSGRSRVTQIAQCSLQTAGKCLPPTKFTYHDSSATTAPDVYTGNGKYNLSSTQMMDPTNGKYGILLGDFDGDGRTDILRWGDSPANNQLLLSKGDGSFTSTPTNLTSQRLFSYDGCYVSFVADFNGDGLVDIFRYENATSVFGTACPTPPSGQSRNLILINAGNGNFNPPINAPDVNRTQLQYTSKCSITGQNPCEQYTGTWTAGANFYFLDVNGDGILDLLSVAIPAGSVTDYPPEDPMPLNGPCASTTCTTLYVGSVPSPGNFKLTATATNLANVDIYTDPVGAAQTPWPTYFDVNYDGYADLVGAGSVLSDQSRTFYTYTDPRTGIQHRSISGSQLGVWFSNGDGNFSYVGMTPGRLTLSTVVDANGDGKLDGLIPGTGSGAQLMVSDGSQFQVTPSFNLNGAGNETASSGLPSNVGIQIVDVNGDGRGDIIRWEDSMANNAVFLSNGDGTFRKSTTTNLSAYQLKNSTNVNDFVVADFTGHGSAEILLLNAPSSTSFGSSLLVKADATPSDQLVSVISPSGSVTTVTMVPLSNSADAAGKARYTSDRGKANAAAYPTMDISAPMWVVATETKDSGVGSSTVSTDYSYWGLKADMRGRGSLGFRQVNRQAPGADGTLLTVSTQYLQMQPYLGLAAATQTTRTSDGLPISSTTNRYCDTTATNQTSYPCPLASLVQRPYLQQTVEWGWDLDAANTALPTVTTTNVINGTGDPTSVTVTTTGTAAGVAETYTKTVTNSYLAADTSGNNWVLGRLSSATVTNTVSPNPTGLIGASAGSGAQAAATSGSATPLTVSASPASVAATATSPSGTVSASTALTNGGYPTPPLAYAFTRVSSSTNTQQITASGGPTVTFSANAANLTAQTATETFQITVTDAVGRTGSVNVTASLSGVQPSVIIVPGWTNWGTVGAGSDSGDFSTVTNNGSVSALLTAHAPVSGPTGMWSYSVSAAGYCNFGTTVLAPGASCTTFFGMGAIATPGTYTATDQVSYQAQGVTSSTFTVRQTYSFSIATSSDAPSALAFGTVAAGSTSGAQTITLTNSAGEPFDNLAVTLGGSNPGNFAFTNNCGTSIASNGSCAITVTFKPTAAAAYSGSLGVTGQYSRYTSAGKNNYYPTTQTLAAVALSGTGAAPSVTSASFNPTTVNSGSASTFTWATANATSATVTCTAPASGSGSGLSGSISVSTSGTGTGTCTVTATDAAGLQATGSANLTVNPPFSVTFSPPSGTNLGTAEYDFKGTCTVCCPDASYPLVINFTVSGGSGALSTTINSGGSNMSMSQSGSGTYSGAGWLKIWDNNTGTAGVYYPFDITVTVGGFSARYTGNVYRISSGSCA